MKMFAFLIIAALAVGVLAILVGYFKKVEKEPE
jgi:hypothetical protein